MSAQDWKQPKPITRLDLAFGRIDGLMPAQSEIPKEFRDGHTKWNKFFSDWFYFGVHGVTGVAEGVDEAAALAHLAAISRSFEPKHEHKEAAVAYLASLWFPNIAWTRAQKKAQP